MCSLCLVIRRRSHSKRRLSFSVYLLRGGWGVFPHITQYFIIIKNSKIYKEHTPYITTMKAPITPKTQIVSKLRQLWLRSRERAQALKDADYSCHKCGVKQSKAKGREQKVVVHHKEGVLNWDKIIELIREQLLTDPTKLEVLCPECHRQEHAT